MIADITMSVDNMLAVGEHPTATFFCSCSDWPFHPAHNLYHRASLDAHG